VKHCSAAKVSPDESFVPKSISREILRECATGSLVLLKNSKGLLPLDAKKLTSLAVIGPNAGTAIVSGGGSAALRSIEKCSPLAGLQAHLGNGVRITQTCGAFSG